MEMYRKRAESCDSLQGFHLLHHMGGGTGGGLGSLITVKLHEEYPKKVLSSCSLFSDPAAYDIGKLNCNNNNEFSDLSLS